MKTMIKLAVRALVERGLRQLLVQRRQRAAPYKLRRATFMGKGLLPEAQGQSDNRLCVVAYEDRGGTAQALKIASHTTQVRSG